MNISRCSVIGRFVLLLPFLINSLWAADGASTADNLNAAMAPVADVLENIIFYSLNVAGQGLPIVLVVLGGTAIFLTIYFKFLNLRSIGLAFRTARGKYTRADAPGQITHFQALTAALSATVGLGNIAGVAVAVGPWGSWSYFLDDSYGLVWHDHQVLRVAHWVLSIAGLMIKVECMAARCIT